MTDKALSSSSEKPEYSIKVPRRVPIRLLIKAVSRTIATVLARPRVVGFENLPKRGPAILVGNHIAVIEAGMMTVYAPYIMELIGAGDIPLDPRYAWVANAYGIIPIKRGSMDRDSLTKALDVLKQGGVLGIFPEGGIWETNLKQARNGVAWLSNKANAPVIPIGFGGVEGAYTKMMRFQRPIITMNIGKPIPPVSTDVPGLSRKQALNDAADSIMQQVVSLIPEEERRLRQQNYIGETFDFQLALFDGSGQPIATPDAVQITDREALSKLFHRPVMMDVFARNLKLPVKVLLKLGKAHPPAEIAEAADHMLAYLATNPYFFHYRFGNAQGASMVRGLNQLRDAARWAAEQPGMTLQLRPIRRYTLIDTHEEVVEEVPAHVQDI